MTKEQLEALRYETDQRGWVDGAAKRMAALARKALNEREALLEALKAAADKLLWANSNLMHSWAQEQPCSHEAAEEASEGEAAARAAIAKAEAE